MNRISTYGFRDMGNRYMVTADMQEGIFTVMEHSEAFNVHTFTIDGFKELRNIVNELYRAEMTEPSKMPTELRASDIKMPVYEVTAVHGTRILGSGGMDKIEASKVSEDIGYEVVAYNLLYRAFHQLRRIGETVLLTTELAKLSKYIQADIREYLGYATPTDTDTEELATVNTETLLDELTNCTALLDKLYQHLHEMNIYGINNSVRGESTRIMERIVKQLTALKAIESGTYRAENKCAENKCADIVEGRTF
jgi:hypothetical protein